jgi:Domain of unknown function DUF11
MVKRKATSLAPPAIAAAARPGFLTGSPSASGTDSGDQLNRPARPDNAIIGRGTRPRLRGRGCVMHGFRLVAVRSGARIGAVAMVLAIASSLTTPSAFAASQTANSADLGVTVQPQNQVVTLFAGGLIRRQFLATVVNYGPSTADNVVLTATLSANAFNISTLIPCSRSGQTVTCTQSSLAPAANLRVYIDFSVWEWANNLRPASVTASVSSTTPDLRPGNSTASGTISFLCFNRDTCYLR